MEPVWCVHTGLSLLAVCILQLVYRWQMLCTAISSCLLRKAIFTSTCQGAFVKPRTSSGILQWDCMAQSEISMTWSEITQHELYLINGLFKNKILFTITASGKRGWQQSKDVKTLWAISSTGHKHLYQQIITVYCIMYQSIASQWRLQPWLKTGLWPWKFWGSCHVIAYFCWNFEAFPNIFYDEGNIQNKVFKGVLWQGVSKLLLCNISMVKGVFHQPFYWFNKPQMCTQSFSCQFFCSIIFLFCFCSVLCPFFTPVPCFILHMNYSPA